MQLHRKNRKNRKPTMRRDHSYELVERIRASIKDCRCDLEEVGAAVHAAVCRTDVNGFEEQLTLVETAVATLENQGYAHLIAPLEDRFSNIVIVRKAIEAEKRKSRSV
mgnify:CR=1 FL=1